ncbi:MAG: hypothetical protein ABF673_10725 [Acetobacter persici]
MQDTLTVLTQLMVAERPTLLRLMYRIIKNRDAAEDAVQSLFEKIQRVEQTLIIGSPNVRGHREWNHRERRDNVG